MFNIQTRSEREVEQYLVEDREVRELVLLFRDQIDGPPYTERLPNRPWSPTPAPPPASSERSPPDCTVDEVVHFFSQENIYSVIFQRQSTVTLSTRAAVETIRNNGADGVNRLMAEGNDLTELLEVFRADILRHGEELGLREAQGTGQSGHAEHSPQGHLLSHPACPGLRNDVAMMVEGYEPSIEDAVNYFKEMPPEELLNKQDFLSDDEQ